MKRVSRSGDITLEKLFKEAKKLKPKFGLAAGQMDEFVEGEAISRL